MRPLDRLPYVTRLRYKIAQAARVDAERLTVTQGTPPRWAEIHVGVLNPTLAELGAVAGAARDLVVSYVSVHVRAKGEKR